MIRHHDPCEQFVQLEFALSVVKRIHDEVCDFGLSKPEWASRCGIKQLVNLKKFGGQMSW